MRKDSSQPRLSYNYLPILIAVSVVTVFATDLILPWGVAQGILYILPVILTLLLRQLRSIYLVALLCGALTVIGYFLSPAAPLQPQYVALLNRAYTLFAIGLIAVVSSIHRQLTGHLEESEEKYRALVDLGGQVGETIIMLEDTEQGEGIQKVISNQWLRLTGYSSEELLNSSFFNLLHPKDRAACLERHRRKMRGESLPGLFEVTITRKDGTEVPVELTSAYSAYAGKRVNVIYLRDITERKQAERALAQQAVALARAEELERSRQRVLAAQEGVRREIAAHLHGRVQGRLLAVKGRLQELLKPANPAAETANILGEAVESMDQVIRNDLSALSRRLYPSIVRRGLVPALESLCDQFETDLEIDRALDPGLAQRERADRNLVAESVRLALYRIAEEALTNVLKHAQAKKVMVRLEVLPQGLLHLTVKDEGHGFVMEGRSPGLGLTAMQDYAEAMGGRCVVHSTPGQGTQVTATLPFLGPDAACPE